MNEVPVLAFIDTAMAQCIEMDDDLILKAEEPLKKIFGLLTDDEMISVVEMISNTAVLATLREIRKEVIAKQH